MDSSKQKTKLIQLTGATATSTSPNKPSDKTKQQTLTAPSESNLTVTAHKAQLPASRSPSLWYIFVWCVNFLCELLRSSSFPSISLPPSSSISCLFFYVVDSTNLWSWPLSQSLTVSGQALGCGALKQSQIFTHKHTHSPWLPIHRQLTSLSPTCGYDQHIHFNTSVYVLAPKTLDIQRCLSE